MSQLGPNLPGPDAEPERAPDLQQATGQPSGGQGSLLDAIGGMGGSIPNAAILSLLQGPSFGQRMGQAMAGGVAFMRNQPNPATAIIEQQQQQQMGIVKVLEQMQAREDLNNYRKTLITDRDREFRLKTEQFQNLQREQDLKKNELALTTMRGVLDNPLTTPATLAIVGPQYAAQMKKTFGVDLPPTVVQRTMDSKEQDNVLMDLQNGLPPELILKNHPAMTPEDLQAFTAIKDNPTVLERLKLKSPQEREKLALEIRGLNADLLEKEHPELRLDPKIGAAALMKAQVLYPGQQYRDLPEDVRGRVYSMTVLEHRQQVLADERAKAEMQANVQLSKLPAQLAMHNAAALSLDQAKKNLVTVGDSKNYYMNTKGDLAPTDLTVPEAVKAGYNMIDQKTAEALVTGQQAMVMLSNIKDTVKEMKDAGLFVTKSGLPGLFQQGTIAYKSHYGDPETAKRLLGNLEAQKGEMISLMRSLGEKGVRAMSGLLPAMDILNPSKGAPAIEQFLGNIESALRIVAERSKAPQAYDAVPTLFPRRPPKDIPGMTLSAPSNDWKIEEVPP